MRRAGYRVRQFWHNLSGRVPGTERAEIAAVLGPELFGLFSRMAPGEQRHAWCVWRTVHQTGPDDPELRVAALLHDVGKSRTRLTVFERSAYVLFSRFAPALAARLSRAQPRGLLEGEPRGWRRAFVVGALHPEWGARMATQAGASARTVDLIGRHQDDPRTVNDAALLALMRADESN